jgi:hypothetical protein
MQKAGKGRLGGILPMDVINTLKLLITIERGGEM